jgi:hypothetical protein
MTPEELDDAVAVEALRICEERPMGLKFRELAQTAARLAREGWTPPEPVDPDLLAYRKWEASRLVNYACREEVLAGKWDGGASANAYLAGARMAREQERERAKELLEYIRDLGYSDYRIEEPLAAYKAGRAA